MRNEVKNGLGGEIKQKVSKFEDLEKAKKELENKLLEKNEAAEREKQALEEQLRKKGEELEAKNKIAEQPKQSNAALYTATAGMGLAAGLIAFTALERTVRLEMLVMIGIAVTSALVVGGITYAALPSIQVDGAKAQEVNENGKKK